MPARITGPKKKRGKKEFYIGCSGYYYPNWKNEFYPPKLAPRHWLEHYSTVFNTVELNGTFYRMPKPADLKRYYAATPADFKFSVKMSRYVTHILRLKNAQEKVAEFIDLMASGLKEKLHKVLFQMPPSFHYTDENLDAILNSVPPGPLHVIEFRHQSWWNRRVLKLLKERGIIFCNVDYPGLQNKFVSTGDHFYLRFHGVPELFKSPYTENQLKDFYKTFPRARTFTVYFNNTYYGAAWRNALSLMELAGVSNNGDES